MTSYNKNQGDVLFSERYLFDVSIDAQDTVFTRGLADVTNDDIWHGGKYLDMENFIGQTVHVLAYPPKVGTTVVAVIVEQCAVYDSAAFGYTSGTRGWNYGYENTKTMFGSGIAGNTTPVVVRDSFLVEYPIVRLRMIETGNANSGTFYLSYYVSRPDEQFSAPNGEYKRLNSNALRELIRALQRL